MKIEGSVAVVTGAAGSIGSEIARALSVRGAQVDRWDVGSHEPDVVSCSVSDEEAVEAAFDQTVSRLGVPTILINAAGVSGGRSPWAADVIEQAEEPFSRESWRTVLASAEAWRAVVDVNIMGVVNTSRAFARRASEIRAKACIVNITSVSADDLVDPEAAAYCSSKAAVKALTRISAANFASIGIRVNAVAPGLMEGRMKVSGVAGGPAVRADVMELLSSARALTPLENRLGHPSDVAEAVLGFLEADFVTGQTVAVDGGLMLRSSVVNRTRPIPRYFIEE